MSEEKSAVQKMADEINDKLKAINTAVENKVEADTVEELKGQLADLVEKAGKVETLEATIKAQGEEITKLSTKGARGEVKTVRDFIREGYVKGLEAWNKTKQPQTIELEIKAIDAGNFTGEIPQAMREAGINKSPVEGRTIRSIMFNGTSDSDTIDWIERTGTTGVPLTRLECETLPEEESNYTVANAVAKKVGGMTVVSEEKLEDITWMLNEIQSELIERHETLVDNQLLAGDGVGSNILGVIPQATAFAAGSFALAVVDANKTDVLRVAINQIRVQEFMATDIVLHPDDVASMELEKASDGHYVLPPFRSADGLTVKGISVTESTKITAGDFLVGDFSRAGVFQRRALRLEIGHNGTDFADDKKSVKLTERIIFRIKGQDLPAFVTGDFATAIAAILKP